MARGAVRGAAVAWLGLVALDALLSNHGSTAAGGVLNFANSVVLRALSPDVAAIPDYSSGSSNTNAIGGTKPDPTLPYLPSTAVIQSRPDQLPIPGTRTPS